MTSFARLRDVFSSEREPQRALFCTYGLDAGFFEGEVLPALLPVSLSADREAGSKNAYQRAADIALAGKGIAVFYDHLSGAAPELVYDTWRVDVAPRCFHPKLAILDYGDMIRAVVGSANLTRSAWSSLLELFVVEDLLPGVAHSWARALEVFLGRLSAHVTAGAPDLAAEMASRLADVPHAVGDSRLASSWEAPILDELLDGISSSRHVDIVTPFFENDGGPGLFDALRERLGGEIGGIIWTTVDSGDEGPRIRGPEAKLRALFDSGRWGLRAVNATWEGDEEDAPLRALHGKIVAVRHDQRARLVLGSPNATRAAMLAKAPHGNVELGVITDVPARRFRELLPQASVVDLDEVAIVDVGDPSGEDAEGELGAERWIKSALYTAAEGRLVLELHPAAPALQIRYADRPMGTVAQTSPSWSCELRMGAERFVIVSDGTTTSAVPFVVVDPDQLEPRWTAREATLEDFCEVLAGLREPATVPDPKQRSEAGFGDADDQTMIAAQGAIPWRRFLGGVRGLGNELDREATLPRGLAFVLHNPARLQGLVALLDYSRQIGRFTAADHAYALYELEREVHRASLAQPQPPECAVLFSEALANLRCRRDASVQGGSVHLVRQLDLLKRADTSR